jgi:hypothetical protein
VRSLDISLVKENQVSLRQPLLFGRPTLAWPTSAVGGVASTMDCPRIFSVTLSTMVVLAGLSLFSLLLFNSLDSYTINL